ncbi:MULTISPECIES: ABC-F family ATP-binding cassette domain-containing protein [Actinoalloteichus]|uniref:ATPase component of ABC transporters with duplicated ATPase domain n=1 Tax=Actinoalloteichus fjordicus TaxID=1612552 RepID=A0AAC9LE08_9PSEU|nr:MULTISPECIES: ABC-F family ATP-binding cassette domain-containing protein [Actinoalloteichus]APU14987.1 ATPase component of ABC transporters with duplicated ATPase domain [Actinoalloteichus fjordicus]APU21053.1 ATPase component of ABC transporters with duplicated ATPase domain [Actinoalloteichus sp. GBA129-24]
MSDAFIICSNLSFSWPDDTPVFQDLSFTVGGGRTGLVAPNGAGKTTLLRLIAGECTPTGGTVSVDGVLGYLPQNLPLAGDLTVADVLGIAPLIRALAAIEAGDVDEAHFTTIGAEWDVEERTRAQLGRLGLGELPFTRRLDTLSGGQIVSLGLAAQLLKRPDVLLLDEPTNNLDLDARRALYAVLEEWTGCLLLVSHDRALLDRMDRIAELDRGEVRFYGGNHTEYEAAVRAAREVAEKNVRNAEQEVRREKREMQQARERAARRAGNAARTLKSAGLPRIVAGAMKRGAQESAGRANEMHAARVSEAKARLDEAGRAVRDEQTIALELPGTHVPAGRTVFSGERLQAAFGTRPLFAGSGVDLTIRGPERIALVGANGAGKSTLLRMINGDVDSSGGVIARADGRIAYLSQRLDLLDSTRTVVENLAAAAPAMTAGQRLTLLARFLFRGDRVHLPVGVLSGGELLRATLCCVLCAEPAPQLLLLDEPTNNLDLVSVARLESALGAYEGAFVVVSHDERFLAEIGVNRWLRLSDGTLRDAEGPDGG